ncbi:MAG: hypothetical protein AAFY72_12005, partial [Cyanobacteria bacterium J06649_4]
MPFYRSQQLITPSQSAMSQELARSSALHQLWAKLPHLSKKAATTLLLAGIWLGVDGFGVKPFLQWSWINGSGNELLRGGDLAIAQTSPSDMSCPTIPGGIPPQPDAITWTDGNYSLFTIGGNTNSL